MPKIRHISFRVAALPFSLFNWELTVAVTEHLLPARGSLHHHLEGTKDD